MNSLHGKKALITGGSRGIGRAITEKMAEAGAQIAITYLSDDAAAQDLELSLKKFDKNVLIYKADVSDRSDMITVMNSIKEKWGNLDILVNNAGINRPTDFNLISDEDWDAIFAVNLKGPFIVSQLAFPLLEMSKNASIINIGSVSGQYGGPRTAHYAASKAGLISLSQVLARFGAEKGVRSNTIAAGIIASDMGGAGLAASSVAKAAENILLRRLGSFNDVASTAVFLASDESNYITAQTFNVNGGLYF